MLCVMGNKKENNFKVVVGEICSSIQVNFKVMELVKKALIIYIVLNLKREHILYVICDRKGSGFKVVTAEIYPNIRAQ